MGRNMRGFRLKKEMKPKKKENGKEKKGKKIVRERIEARHWTLKREGPIILN